MSNRRFSDSNGAPVAHVTEFDEVVPVGGVSPYTPGTRVKMADGREFIWGEATGTIAAGRTVQQTNVLVPDATGTLSA